MKKILFYFVAFMIMASPVFSANISIPVNEVPANAASDFRNAVKEFKGLPKKERKARIKEAKKQIKEIKKQKKAGEPVTDKTLLIILAILLPPLAVYLHEGVINSKFWIDLLLTLLFYIPGMIYALIVVTKND